MLDWKKSFIGHPSTTIFQHNLRERVFQQPLPIAQVIRQPLRFVDCECYRLSSPIINHAAQRSRSATNGSLIAGLSSSNCRTTCRGASQLIPRKRAIRDLGFTGTKPVSI
jgi:hypothetical protein